MAKIAIYMRISTDEQSLNSQKHELDAWLEYRRLDNVAYYIDEGYSGKNTNRPALKALLQDIDKGLINTIVIQKLDRLFRSQLDLLNTLAIFQNKNVALVSLKENIDLSTPIGRLTMQLLGSFAEFERSMIVQRVKAGLAAAQKRGIRLGAVPRLTQSHIDTIIQEKLNGRSIRAISEHVGFSVATVHRVIKNNLMELEHRAAKSNTADLITNIKSPKVLKQSAD